MKTQTKKIIYLSILLIGISFLQVSAAELLWQVGNGSWNDPGKWFRSSFPAGQCNCIPTANDNVTISNSATVTIPESGMGITAAARQVKITNGAELKVGGTFPFHKATLNIGSGSQVGLEIESGGKLFVFAQDRIIIDGIRNFITGPYAINNSGDIDVGVNASITITNSDGGIFSNDGIINKGTIDISDIKAKRGLHVINFLDNRPTGIINISDINHGVGDGQGIYLTTDFTLFNNQGAVSISDVNDNALHVFDNSIFNNVGDLLIDNFREAGIRVDDDGAFFTSDPVTISNGSGANSFGVRVEVGGEFRNDDKINISNINQEASILNKGEFTNRADAFIFVSDFANEGIINSTAGILENQGEISVFDNTGNANSHGIRNFGEITIGVDAEIQIFNISGSNSHGFFNDTNAIFMNEGRIAVSAVSNGKGIFVPHGEFIVAKNASVVTANIASDPIDVMLGSEFDCQLGCLMDIKN